ncbi:MAG: endo-1,4-beta-xylanase [Treponema sp.]|nr:endo-1,4-beta-xylanase [Treponema sp.]
MITTEYANGLKDVFSKSFKVGAAVSKPVLEQQDANSVFCADKLIKTHFNSITAENTMKFGWIHPEENRYNWNEPDFLADYAKKSGITMRGHTIVWHNQTPSWLFADGDAPVTKAKLFKRLEDHIIALTSRYNDIISSWDVVNEPIDTDKGDENNMRLSEWYKIGGKEIFEFAFKCMREASPNTKLFLNDYNIECGAKMEANLRYLSSMLDAGIPIDGVGLQGHFYFDFPDEKTLRNALERYSALGIEIEFTEVDISLYRWNEGRDKSDFFTVRPEDRVLDQAKRYFEIFTIARDYPSVKNITTWGIADNHTWLDNFPVKERKNWPLLFDEQYNPKPVVDQLLKR